MTYYNIHSHVFTMKNAPERFLSLYMPAFAARLIDKITNTEAGAAALEKILSRLGNGTRRYASFLEIGKSAEEIDVFIKMKAQYENQNFRFVGLTLYMEECGASSSLSGYEGQLEGVLEIKRQYPDQFLIFLGIDPRWKGTARELRKTVEDKFNYRLAVSAGRSVFPYVGLKLYPSTGFYAFDKNLTETFEWAADNGVPVISHCSYLGGIYHNDKDFLQRSINPIDPYSNRPYDKPVYQHEQKWPEVLLGTNRARNNKLTCSYFLEPESYRPMMHYFQNQIQLSASYKDAWFDNYRRSLSHLSGNQRLPLKICLAHYGGSDEILINNGKVSKKPAIGTSSKNWCGQIQQLMKDFDQVYTDISYTLSNQAVHPWILKDLNHPAFGNRILFGTDFFMTERELPEKKDVDIFRTAAQAQILAGNPGLTAWDQIASKNPEKFLFSKYYNGQII